MTDFTAPSSDSSDASLDRSIQRCVDRELSDADERTLLAQLDFHPEGWKRLALACLDDRVLRSAARDWLGEFSNSPDMSSAPMPALRGRGSPGTPRRRLPAALSALVALGVAFFAGRWTLPSGAEGVTQATAPHPLPADVVPDRTLQQAASPADVAPEVSPPRAAEMESEPLMYVSLDVGAGDDEIQVPVYAAPAGSTEWRPFDASTLTSGTAAALRKAGYRIQSSREIVEVASPQGVPILLPSETISIQASRY